MTRDGRRSDDRREHARVAFATSAVVFARHNAGVAFSIESISAGGARLVGPITLGVGERVQLVFEIDGTPIDIEGEVVRAQRQDIVNDRVAVRFENLSNATRAFIHQLVERVLDLECDRLPDQ